MVLNALAKNACTVEIGGALAGNCSALWIAAPDDFGDAAGGVVSDDGFEPGMSGEKDAALRECCRVRLDGFDRVETCAGTTDQVLFDLDLYLVDRLQRFCI